jgi:hypothetical protein
LTKKKKGIGYFKYFLEVIFMATMQSPTGAKVMLKSHKNQVNKRIEVVDWVHATMIKVLEHGNALNISYQAAKTASEELDVRCARLADYSHIYREYESAWVITPGSFENIGDQGTQNPEDTTMISQLESDIVLAVQMKKQFLDMFAKEQEIAPEDFHKLLTLLGSSYQIWDDNWLSVEWQVRKILRDAKEWWSLAWFPQGGKRVIPSIAWDNDTFLWKCVMSHPSFMSYIEHQLGELSWSLVETPFGMVSRRGEVICNTKEQLYATHEIAWVQIFCTWLMVDSVCDEYNRIVQIQLDWVEHMIEISRIYKVEDKIFVLVGDHWYNLNPSTWQISTQSQSEKIVWAIVRNDTNDVARVS